MQTVFQFPLNGKAHSNPFESKIRKTDGFSMGSNLDQLPNEQEINDENYKDANLSFSWMYFPD